MAHSKIMLVEDDPDDRGLFAAAISRVDASVALCYASDGIDALEQLAGEGCKDVKVILLDINMPRMNGWETLARLKGDLLFRDIPVIIFSIYTARQDVERALKLGAGAFLSKPVEVEHIVQLIGRIAAVPGDKVNRILKDYLPR